MPVSHSVNRYKHQMSKLLKR